jgi:dihydroorotate dehydrogenase electron transfer subunit
VKTSLAYPKIVEIKKIVEETKDIKTIIFEYDHKNILPGQFVMVWIPGIDEIPMSISYIGEREIGFTFRKVGEATSALYNLKEENKIGIRGVYGNGFTVNGKDILIVGGGTGIATLAPLIEKISSTKRNRLTVIFGVKTKEEIFFIEKMKKIGVQPKITTDDGTLGFKGTASDLAERLIKKEKFDQVITCGPEKMMKKIVDLCNYYNIPVQASLERYIKCGIGLCGQCCIGLGLRVCKDGPVFDGELLKQIHDFGLYKRDASGRKIEI